jgi:RHH-type proline utilization regulon transcriptional repressor/proline dehydrogenase/delta 1-pyrroline-5-carboxylate dehydrogenase
MAAAEKRDLQARIRELGGELLEVARERKSHFWAREHWEEILLRKLMANPEFRVQALRFVDVLPALRDDQELVRHVREYFGEEELPIPGVARWGMENAPAGVVASAVRVGVHGLASRFIGGSDVKEAFRSVDALRREGMAFTLDLLGEATVSEAEAGAYFEKYLRLLREFPPRLATWRKNPLLDVVSGRNSSRFNLSVKVSSLFSQCSPVDPEGSAKAVKERLRPILRLAREQGAFICLDMEQYDTKDIILRVFREILTEPEFHDWPDVGLAVQAYLRDTEHDLRELSAWARRRGTPITVRLVRGAYWDYETVIARQNDWKIPVFTEKWETDASYERCLRILMEGHPHLEAAVASHNVRSLALALALAEERGLRNDQWELQMLFGMADPLKDALAKMGYRVRVYVPFGELIPGMSYLVRRLLENTASQSFLRMGFAEDVSPDILLAPPGPKVTPPTADGDLRAEKIPLTTSWARQGHVAEALQANSPGVFDHLSYAIGSPDTPFRNEPPHRFTADGERAGFAAAVERVRGQLGRDYPLYLHGREQWTGDWLTSMNPARPSECVGRVAQANPKDAEAAVRSALAAFPAWRDTSVHERATLLIRAAAKARERRDELSAWEVFEAGKTWREADADVTEAIDFLEYYAREAVKFARVLPLNVPGEMDHFFYQPRGDYAVIPPWNFPLAILTGMLSAAIVTGNTAVLKPAPQTPVIAAKLLEILREVGLPDGVANFVYGGAEVGEYLVTHPEVHGIAFTGSLAVGQRIYRLAAEVQPGQEHLKRVIAELGGKNALIVDADADIDDAVVGTVASAFGFQGQKCSAASRLITVGSVHEPFVRRLIEAARSLQIGMPEAPGTYMGPVIDATARDRIRAAIEAGKKVATTALETDVSAHGEGYFVGPTLFTEVPPESALAQDEIFGPVLGVMHARTFDEALELAMKTRFGLTGGVYSRSPEHLERARERFRVGNLYLNRKITGAIVGRQPFGGFKLSGLGSKAGGPDYLLQFLEPRMVTENIIRRGFAPDVDVAAVDLGGL